MKPFDVQSPNHLESLSVLLIYVPLNSCNIIMKMSKPVMKTQNTGNYRLNCKTDWVMTTYHYTVGVVCYITKATCKILKQIL